MATERPAGRSLDTASSDGYGRRANRRQERRDVRTPDGERELRHLVAERNDGTKRDVKRGRYASRQVLQYPAFEAIVIGGVSRAAGYRGGVEVMALGGRVVHIRGRPGGRRGVRVRNEFRGNPGQRPERRPRERDERVRRNARSPAAKTSNQHPRSS